MKKTSSAFSLYELLAAIAVIALLLSLSTGAFNNMANSSKLSGASQAIVDKLVLARETAMASGEPVEVRIYAARGKDGRLASRWLQIYGTNGRPLDDLFALPAPFSLSDDPRTTSFLKLEEQPSETGPPAPDDATDWRFRRFRFNSDGATTLDPAQSWFLSVRSETGPQDGPAGLSRNFATIQIDPVTGRTRVFRP